MYMARPTPHPEFPQGPENQQLPSFRHFLSGVEQSENAVRQQRPNSTQLDVPNAFRRELFDPRNDFTHPQLKPEPISNHQVQHAEQQPHGRRPLLPQGTYSSTSLREHSSQDSAETHPYRPHHDVPVIHDLSPTLSTKTDTGPAKTVVSETIIDGKGLCYVYDDGSVCPKAVNGDAVNPKWGTTRAGKPRKRLGQACNTCREKKIRCDPQLPKCAQCQKFGRECRFETGSRGSHKGSASSARASPTTPELKKDTGHDRHGSSASAETPSEQLCSRENSRSSINVESLLSPSSTALSEEAPPSKKRRMSMSSRNEFNSDPAVRHPGTPNRSASQHSTVRLHPHFSADTSPLEADPAWTLRCVRKYLDTINSQTYHILPSIKFLEWVNNGRHKTNSDLIVLYAIMAFSQTYSRSDDGSNESRSPNFADITESLMKRHNNPDFHLAVGYLISSFQALSEGNMPKSKHLVMTALQICCDLGLSREEGISHLVQRRMPCFDLDTESAKECVRRMFWLAYVSRGLLKYCPNGHHPIQTLDCALRLPCDDALYDAGNVPSLPTFRHNASNKRELLVMPEHGIIAFLVEMTLILEEVIHFQHTAAPNYRQEYDIFYQKMKPRLIGCDKKLRAYFSNDQRAAPSANVDSPRSLSIEDDPTIGASGLHLLYHFVAIAFYRHVAWEHLAPDKVDRCVKESHKQAVRIFELIRCLDEDGGSRMPFFRMAREAPIAVLPVFSAIDVITAAGAFSELLEHQNEGDKGLKEMVSYAAGALEELSQHWPRVKVQLEMVKARIGPMLSSSQTSRKNAFFFREPMFSPFGLDHDVVYGLPRIEYLRALGLGNRVRSENDLMEMGVQSPT